MWKLIAGAAALALTACFTLDETITPEGGMVFRIAVAYRAVSNGTFAEARDERADALCPGGWTVLAEGDLAATSYGGRWWRIRCA